MTIYRPKPVMLLAWIAALVVTIMGAVVHSFALAIVGAFTAGFLCGVLIIVLYVYNEVYGLWDGEA